jgi:tetratricopeptide (TPR) repeat protein
VTDKQVDDQEPTSLKRSGRLRRLLKLLVVVALVWAAVTIVRRLIPPSPLELARSAVTSGRFEDAADRYRDYLSSKPEDWSVRGELGLVLAEFDRPAALVEFRKIPPQSDAYVDARRQIVSLCIASERYREAEEVLLDLSQRIPTDFLIQFTLAEMYFHQNKAQAGIPFAQQAVTLNPDDAPAQFLLAELLDDLGRTAEMIAPLRRVIELQIDHYAAHLNLAYACADTGDATGAKREAEWCLARNPKDVNALRFLAMSARDQGNVEESQKQIERALALAPDDVPCRLLEAELLLFQRKAAQAMQRLQPLYEKNTQDRRLVALLARAASAAGLPDEAAKYRQQVQKLSE